MRSRNRIISLLVLILGSLGYQSILAGTVYQWTDEAGNINFSDVPPADSVATETHEFVIEQAPDSNVDYEQYSIINQVEIMAEWRRQLTDERLAKKQLYLEEKRLEHELELSEREEDYADGYVSRVYYYNNPYQLPYRRHHGASILPYPTHHGKTINVLSHSRNIKSKCC